MNKIGYIILNYNNWHDTLKCLNSLNSVIKKNEFIYVVDNASNENPPQEYIELLKYPYINHIQSSINGGFSYGNNIGADLAISEGCDYIFICNNDLIFNESISESMLEYLMNNSDVAIVSPKILGTNGLPQEINTGDSLTLLNKYKYILKSTPFSFLVHKFISKNNALDYKYDVALELYSVSGCCFLVAKSALKIIFPLDEEFFLYMEEQAIGAKLKLHNLKAVLLPSVSVVHAHGQSTAKVAAFSFSCLAESEIIFFKKYRKSSLIFIMPLIFLRIFQYTYRSLRRNDYKKNLSVFFYKIKSALKKKYA